jgi:hypothetical protein
MAKEYDFSKDTSFGTTIMYYYSFNEDIQKKQLDILLNLIEKHNGVYKLIFEIIVNNNRYKIDYNNKDSDQLIKNPECIISKLYVLKYSELFNHMFYYEINENLVNYFELSNVNHSINCNLNIIAKPYDEFDQNKNKLVLSSFLKPDLKISNINIKQEEIKNNIFMSKEIDFTDKNVIFIKDGIFTKGKIIGNSLFVTVSKKFIKDQINEQLATLTNENSSNDQIDILKALIANKDLYKDIWFEYSIKYMFVK